MADLEGPLYFLSHMRRGVGQYRSAGGTLAVSADIEADGKVEPVAQELALIGPEHVTALSRDQILRQVPEPGSAGFEPNLLAAVEFAMPDLPWLFSPAMPDATGQIAPWLALVVVRDGPGITLRNGDLAGGAPGLKVLEIRAPAVVARELPELAGSWAWAHVQVTADLEARSIADAFAQSPELFRSRLVCPRRLQPLTSYTACIVPTYRGGVAQGLGLSPSPSPHEPAWTGTEPAIELPVYQSWSFRTGVRGDFEALVRKLTPVELTAGAVAMDLSDPGDLRLPGAADVGATFRGALVGTAAPSDRWDEGHKAAWVEGMAEILATHRPGAATDKPDYHALRDDPVVAPPLWGGLKIGESTAPDKPELGAEDKQPWFPVLNHHPRHRAGAGLGAEIVRRNQEDLMAEAWTRYEGLREVNRAFNQTRLAAETGAALKARKIDPLTESAALRLTTHAGKRLGPPTGDLEAMMAAKAIPAGFATTALARVTRRRSVVGRRTGVEAPVATAAAEFVSTAPEVALRFTDYLAPDGIAAGDYVLQFDLPTATVQQNRERDLYLGRRLQVQPVPRTGTLSVGSGFGLRRTREVSLAFRPGMTARRGLRAAPPALDMAKAGLDPAPPLAARLKARVTVPPRVFRDTDFPGRHLVEPVFDRTGYRMLRGLSADAVMPGINAVEINSVGLARINAAFVEAFLVGMNAEMAREMLWREFPGLLSGTYFRRFWDTPAMEDDIAPIAKWDDAPLGQHQQGAALGGTTVLVVKAEVFQRYPEIEVYASAAAWDDRGFRFEPRENGQPVKSQAPIFGGWLDRRTAFYAFDIPLAEMKGTTEFMGPDPGWFFVFEQARSGVQFGLDAPGDDRPQSPATWQEADWAHAIDPPDGSGDATHLSIASVPASGNLKLAADQAGRATWGRSAAEQAQILFQQPMRVLMHASGMLA